MTKKEIRKKFRTEVIERDGGECRVCRGNAVDVHHITNRYLMPNGGYVRENGISLCSSCHWKAEEFHRRNGSAWHQGYHPNDLYTLIGSSYELALEKSKKS